MARKPISVIMAFGMLVTVAASAETVADAGRRILEEHKSAVVTMRVVIETQMSGPGFSSDRSESTAEITGTVIAPDGLIVTSLSQTDPASTMRSLGVSRGRDMSFESKPTDIQILLEDGAELPAEEVLRDADLDLSFIRPIVPPEEPMHYIDLASGETARILDRAVVLNRLGRVVNRTYSASIETIEAVVERPRTFYIPGRQDTRSGLGSPAFSAGGKPLGLVLVRTISAASGGFQSAGRSDSMTPIILPGVDILEAVEQVPPRETGAGEAEGE